MLSSLLLSTGVLLFLHAAYSCLHYQELLLGLEESGLEGGGMGAASNSAVPPLDVCVEVLAGFCIILLSQLIRSGSALQPISNSDTSAKRPRQPLAAPPYRTLDFDIYSGRGKML